MELLRSWIGRGDFGSILEIGGHLDPSGVQLIETYGRRDLITVVNIDPLHLAAVKERYPEITVKRGDARQLDFPDRSFDLVYSNAVIEHVGDWDDQRAMAGEIMRLGRRWFVSTPNRWFPFELHTRLPFVGWLPSELMRSIAKVCSYSHVRRRYERGIEQQIRLLTAREMTRLFPTSRVVRVRVTVWPETLVAMGAHEEAEGPLGRLVREQTPGRAAAGIRTS